jgi:hypothetical protein
MTLKGGALWFMFFYVFSPLFNLSSTLSSTARMALTYHAHLYSPSHTSYFSSIFHCLSQTGRGNVEMAQLNALLTRMERSEADLQMRYPRILGPFLCIK